MKMVKKPNNNMQTFRLPVNKFTKAFRIYKMKKIKSGVEKKTKLNKARNIEKKNNKNLA
jgi:hypothetical protein